MIEFREGDILRADAEALVNTVNCVGAVSYTHLNQTAPR